ncbi:MAG: transcription termination factor Rho [Propionibacteriaceae bacterium]|nr:transcription termination factor Rho [Propionibacteriaceae bacterium]
MKLPELKEAAGALGIKGTSAMKKADLVAAITSARGGHDGSRASKSQARSSEAPEQEQRQESPRADAQGEHSAGKSSDGDEIGARLDALSRNRRSRQRSRSDEGEQPSDTANDDNRDRSETNDRSASSAGGSDEDGPNGSRRRRRQRDRNNRNTRRSSGDDRDSADPTVREDDVLLEIAGILDVLENYAFVRTSGYLPGPSDAYVSLSMVRKFDLRKGDVITGAVRQPRDGERAQKYQPLVRLDKVNGVEPDAMRGRPEFAKLTPLYPQERLRLETTGTNMAGRIMDLMSPIGKGQRGLIVSPPKAGKTMIMQSIANSITTNNPEVYLMVVLVDERPEEVTDFQRTTTGEVIASTFDRPAEDHTTVAELAVERAKRLVELGHDVVILLDGITRLGRAYNQAAPASGRILSGGVDSAALYPPKKFFGAARNIENGGSLTILATALVETGSKMDEVIFEEFKGTGNMELRLSRQLADKRIFPAVDVDASGTRREELLMNPPELKLIWGLRRGLAGMEDQQALEVLLSRMRKTQNNAEFLMMISKSAPASE